MSIVPANEGISKLKPYQPGKPISELERELGITDIVKLASNENPLGCSDKVKEAVTAEIAEIGRYPDGGGFILKDQIHKQFGFAHDRITLGNGSNDLLEMFARTFVSDQDSVLYSQHAFAVYALLTQAINAQAIEVPAKGFSHDLDAMAAAIQDNTKLIFIANPNNPTGTWFNQAALNAFLAKVPDNVLVVLDEAYIEYAADSDLPDGMAYLSRYPNLLVSRTFSKAYGLAALRVGYAVSSAAIADVLNRVRQPFNVNSLALVAACAALDDAEYLERSRTLNSQGMQQLEDGFKRLGLSWIPSRGNFIAVDFQRDAAAINQGLLAQGVIVRPVAGYGMPTFLRISIGTAEENQRFLDALTLVLQQV